MGTEIRDDDRAQPYDKELELWLQLHGLSQDDLKRERIIVLWSRFSGKKGDLHPEHDTSFEGMRQLVDMARGTGGCCHHYRRQAINGRHGRQATCSKKKQV